MRRTIAQCNSVISPACVNVSYSNKLYNWCRGVSSVGPAWQRWDVAAHMSPAGLRLCSQPNSSPGWHRIYSCHPLSTHQRPQVHVECAFPGLSPQLTPSTGQSPGVAYWQYQQAEKCCILAEGLGCTTIPQQQVPLALQQQFRKEYACIFQPLFHVQSFRLHEHRMFLVASNFNSG